MSSASRTIRNEDVAAAAPAVTNGGGRLGALADLTALLDAAPEARETLEAVAEGAARATAADAVQIVLSDPLGGEPSVYTAGSGRVLPGAPRVDLALRTDAGGLGEMTLARAPGRAAFAEADALFARTLADHMSRVLAEARAKRPAPPAPPRERRRWFGR